MQLRGAWDRNNPRLLGKQPGESDLRRGRLLSFGNAAEQINQGLIRLESLLSEARQGAAEVGAVEGGVFVDLASEKPLAQRAVRDKADSEFFEGRYHFRFRLSPPSASIRSGVPSQAEQRVRDGLFVRLLQRAQSASLSLPESSPLPLLLRLRSPSRFYLGYSDLSDAISITKRYFTSDLSSRS